MKVIIQKPDLDTCLTALILGVTTSDDIVVSRGEASDVELRNPEIMCIEAGGSGLTGLLNFDHHSADRYYPPACLQAYNYLGSQNEKLSRLVDYVCMVDDRSSVHPPVPFPSLSNIFSGMLFVEKNPCLQFFRGMEILRTVIDKSIDPFGTMSDLNNWREFKDAKAQNTEKLTEVLKNAIFCQTAGGLKVGYAESDAIGGIGALYGQGCGVVILFNPSFGDPPTRKYTIAGNNVSVSHLLSHLEQIEQGWGGRESIIGSPRVGSALPCETIIDLVVKNI